ncbi:MAG: dTDP-4-amino-4,6-dideoxygalactose transaminase [Candidatus Omnitrophica bacterium]|nr:dTDP-4-amino-4,6-dideoxygalactose transaminase [Candidatus Omnitrophota bacterium]MBU2251155.1 dTDP-4-amino-4,6-dideoxygalactose transaminase [Candidatus Omnitrophota bacterium]MBU2266012.1 dTDP-4-amino-4,6-dideoxygalactose transaminase [Candidatus Omnitrophota bacterium]
MKIPFNLPYLSGNEQKYISAALGSSSHAGNGFYGQRCIELLKERYGFKSVFLTPSCTAAMEMGALLADLKPSDEVILPSYTFTSTANAIVLRGAKPIFCDIEESTMNIDVSLIESKITEKTKMIVPIDYAGIPCEIEPIMALAKRYDLMVMEDAAQGLHSFYKDKPCGFLPPLAAFSFHESKNISCGEGGALVVNKPEFIQRARFLQEKGTDRDLVLKDQKKKYGWVDVGSSFLLSDILAAMLLSQLENVENIVKKRSLITKAYSLLLTPYQEKGCLKTPKIPPDARINHHAFFVIFDLPENREQFLILLRQKNIFAYVGYSPLHSSTYGFKLGFKPEDVPRTQDLAQRIVRLPFYTGLADQGLDYCLEGMKSVLQTIYGF